MTEVALALFGDIHRRIDTERPRMTSLAAGLQSRADALCLELRDGGHCQRAAVLTAWPISEMMTLARLPIETGVISNAEGD